MLHGHRAACTCQPGPEQYSWLSARSCLLSQDQGASQLACDHHCAGGAHIPASPVVLNCGHAVCGLISPLGLHSCSDPQQLRPSCPECSAKVQVLPCLSWTSVVSMR